MVYVMTRAQSRPRDPIACDNQDQIHYGSPKFLWRYSAVNVFRLTRSYALSPSLCGCASFLRSSTFRLLIYGRVV
jgi:hypothetical protein